MKFSLPIKALSVNAAYRGRRFNTKEKIRFDRALALMLPSGRVPGEWYRLTYDFDLVNFSRTDTQNLLKPLTDCIVRRGIIIDDRRIVVEIVRKHPAKKDRITVEIDGIDRPAERTLSRMGAAI